MKTQDKIDIHFDMETGDPDDLMTLCLLTAHSKITLRSVSVTPGTDEQIGLVKHALRLLGHEHVPVGSRAPGYDKNCVGGFYYKWFGKFDFAQPDEVGYRLVEQSINKYPDITILTGGPLNTFALLNPELVIKRWVAQGGFAGDNIVPEADRLPKFNGMVTCPTFNFNGAPKVALAMLANENIKEKRLVSKNVCHGVVYNQDWQDRMAQFKHKAAGYAGIYKGMAVYLRKRKEGNKFHYPLAACVAIDPSICDFA